MLEVHKNDFWKIKKFGRLRKLLIDFGMMKLQENP